MANGFSDARASAGRFGDGSSRAGETGRSGGARSGSAGRPGGMGTQRSVFTSQDGLSKGITVAVGPELANKNAQRAATYNAAAKTWNDSAQQRSLENFINALSPMGFSMEPPDLARSKTFADSTYHLGWNPGSLAGLTGLALPGSGLITGPLGQAAYTALGGKNVILGGSGDMGMPTWDAPGNETPASPGGALTPGGGQLADRGGGSSLLPTINGSPGHVPVTPPNPGSQLPPISAPTPQMSPAQWMAIAGPSAYGWQRPSWAVG